MESVEATGEEIPNTELPKIGSKITPNNTKGAREYKRKSSKPEIPLKRDIFVRANLWNTKPRSA